eukprot:5624140-Pyramimonas_sp.AAC.1
MAEEVDPTCAAPGGGGPSDSGITDITCDTDTPVDPEDAATRDMDRSPGRRIVYRAQSIGWIKTRIVGRRHSDKYVVAHSTHGHKVPIDNMALRKPGGIDLNPDRSPKRYVSGAPAGATAKATPKPKTEMIDLPSSFSLPSLCLEGHLLFVLKGPGSGPRPGRFPQDPPR